jgi:hypothetical protein
MNIINLNVQTYFSHPTDPSQKKYEALRSFYLDKQPANQVAQQYGYSPEYFKKLRFIFATQIKNGQNPFFKPTKKGPKKRSTSDQIIDHIVDLRKQNHSINDIKAILESKDQKLSLETIDNILKEQGFAPLPRRTRKERNSILLPAKMQAPPTQPLEIVDEEFSTQRGGGILVFLPLIERLGIVKAIRSANFPQTSVIDDVSSVMCFLALKLIGRERLSHDETWNLDRSLGLFAGLNVLPKNATLSSYSYRILRCQNQKLLTELASIFKDVEFEFEQEQEQEQEQKKKGEQSEFNLDFKAIPHWGDKSVLEKNWSGSRSKALKSLLALIVQEPATGFLSYSNAEIKHQTQSDAVLEFVDFWKEGRGISPKMLIFDSKFTTYENLNRLNQSKEKIKFLTLRRRGKGLKQKIQEIPDYEWTDVKIETNKNKYKTIKVYDSYITLRNYQGDVRQLIITGHGRPQPCFLITNDFDSEIKVLIKKYARRWLVEQEIAEQIKFFHLNQASSSIVVKVDFDLTISLLAHNLYQILASHLPGFEKCNVDTIYRHFIENGASIKICAKDIRVMLKKKTHLPILFELPWMKESTYIPFLGMNIKFETDTVS